MPIIDAHVHVLDRYRPMAPFEDTGRCDRLLHLMDESGVDRALMLPVVADFSPHNNEECARLARQHPDRLSTLTDVPLDQPEAAAKVARARDEFGAVGISYYPPGSDLGWMLEEEHLPLWAAFATHDLVCNLHVAPPNYPVLLELARRYPGVRFTSNHLGLPGKIDADHPDYGRLLEAAALPNLFVKASAFYAAAETPWDFRCPRALSFFERLLQTLGPEKLLWGSDWPPTSRHLTYRQSLEIVRRFAAGLDQTGRDRVLGENAARVFKV